MRRVHIPLALAVLLAAFAFAMPAHAAPVICEKYGSAQIQNGRYIVQNNVWGASTAQCIDVNQNGGFTVTQAAHNNATNGAPAAYPSIYAGCHYAACTTGSGLPVRADASGFGNLRSSVSMSYPGSGTWNAAYDLWFDPTPRTDGQNTGAELMIWLNHRGSIQPIGSRVGTANLAERHLGRVVRQRRMERHLLRPHLAQPARSTSPSTRSSPTSSPAATASAPGI
ncbi:hypothetical protein ACFSTC_61640 [Nonomuraea ferruginea]